MNRRDVLRGLGAAALAGFSSQAAAQEDKNKRKMPALPPEIVYGELVTIKARLRSVIEASNSVLSAVSALRPRGILTEGKKRAEEDPSYREFYEQVAQLDLRAQLLGHSVARLSAAVEAMSSIAAEDAKKGSAPVTKNHIDQARSDLTRAEENLADVSALYQSVATNERMQAPLEKIRAQEDA